VWISDFSNDIVNAKTVFGDTPIEVCALQNNGIEYKYNQEVTYTLSAANLKWNNGL
jgi:ankyrin repeat protein